MEVLTDIFPSSPETWLKCRIEMRGRGADCYCLVARLPWDITTVPSNRGMILRKPVTLGEFVILRFFQILLKSCRIRGLMLV